MNFLKGLVLAAGLGISSIAYATDPAVTVEYVENVGGYVYCDQWEDPVVLLDEVSPQTLAMINFVMAVNDCSTSGCLASAETAFLSEWADAWTNNPTPSNETWMPYSTQLAINGDNVYFFTVDGNAVALDSTTGIVNAINTNSPNSTCYYQYQINKFWCMTSGSPTCMDEILAAYFQCMYDVNRPNSPTYPTTCPLTSTWADDMNLLTGDTYPTNCGEGTFNAPNPPEN